MSEKFTRATQNPKQTNKQIDWYTNLDRFPELSVQFYTMHEIYLLTSIKIKFSRKTKQYIIYFIKNQVMLKNAVIKHFSNFL